MLNRDWLCRAILSLGLGLIVFMAPKTRATPKSCIKVSQISMAASDQNLSKYKQLCRDTRRAYYCQNKAKNLACSSINLTRSKKNWLKTPLRKTRDYKALLTSSYLDIIKFRKPLRLSSKSRVQTGPYSQMTLNTKSPLRLQCLESILYSAQVLQKELPKFNFEIDGKIKKCSNLREGIELIVANKELVTRNLKQIHSPLHTIYFTTESKFNDHILGKMGLYINVEKKNEIKNRLVDFKISQLIKLR